MSATLFREGSDLDALLTELDAEFPGRVQVVDVEYGRDNLGYSLLVLRFREQPAALDYLQVHMANICAISRGVQPMKGIAGVAYVRDDDFGRAVFVAGDSEISVCGCRGRNDDEQRQISADWARAIAAQLR